MLRLLIAILMSIGLFIVGGMVALLIYTFITLSGVFFFPVFYLVLMAFFIYQLLPEDM